MSIDPVREGFKAITADELAQIIAAVKAELELPPVVVPLAATTGYYQVIAGETIQADHMNLAINQGVHIFSSAAQRDAQLPSPRRGMHCYLTDVNYLQVYDNAITGGADTWHVAGGLRMGYGTVGMGQAIPKESETTLTLDQAAGAANRPGRATWQSNGAVVVPLTGTYLATGSITWPSNATGQRKLFLRSYVEGEWGQIGVAGGGTETNVAGSTTLAQSTTAMMYLQAGQYIGLRAYQSSGGTLTLPTDALTRPRLGVHLLGAD